MTTVHEKSAPSLRPLCSRQSPTPYQLTFYVHTLTVLRCISFHIETSPRLSHAPTSERSLPEDSPALNHERLTRQLKQASKFYPMSEFVASHERLKVVSTFPLNKQESKPRKGFKWTIKILLLFIRCALTGFSSSF